MMIRKYLKKGKSVRSPGEHINIQKGKKGFQDESGSVRDIYNWLHKYSTDALF